MDFRKIIAHLAYSPAMIWRLAIYDNKIRKIQKHNFRIILFGLLNLLVLGFAFLSQYYGSDIASQNVNTKPTSSSLAKQPLFVNDHKWYNSSQTDFFNNIYSSSNLSTVYNFFNVTNTTVSQLQPVFSPNSFADCVEITSRSYHLHQQNFNVNSNLSLAAQPCLPRYYGMSVSGVVKKSPFIILSNGNLLLTKQYFNSVVKSTTNSLTTKISVVANTSNSPVRLATTNQELKYTITVTNNSNSVFSELIPINLGDIVEYADVVSPAKHETIYWKPGPIAPSSSASIDIVVRTRQSFSTESLNLNDRHSNDCVMTLAVLNKTHQLPVKCSITKQIERSITQNLTTFKPEVSKLLLISMLIFFALVIIFKIIQNIRISFVSKEIRAIRYKINQGQM